MKPVFVTALVALTAAGALIGRGIASRQSQQASPTPQGSLPAGGIELLEARPFVVDEPFVHEWRAEKPLVDAGYLLVLRVARDLARPRNTAEAVLYVGQQTAERCTPLDGDPDLGEILVVLVPAPVDATGRVELDLDTVPIWFGSPDLPERVDAARIASELAAARAAGIGPAARTSVPLRTTAADTIHTRTRWELQPYVEDWIARYGR